MISRRTFLAAASAAIASPIAHRIAAEEPQPAPPAYIDIHTHLGQTWNTTEPLSAETLLRWMDAHHITHAVVLPLTSPESSSYLITTDFVLEATRPFRDRLLPFCSIDPRTSYNGGKKGLLDILKKWQEAGCLGFGEHKPGISIDDPRSMTLYESCAELKLPLLFHLDQQRNTDKPGLPGLEKVLQSFPEGRFIGHGPGFWASIAGGISAADLGGYPKGKIEQPGALDHLLKTYKNLYCDLSAGSGAGAISRDLAFGREFLIRHQDRILFGTDYLAPKQDVPQFELFQTKIELPPEVLMKVTSDNARELLQLTSSVKE